MVPRFSLSCARYQSHVVAALIAAIAVCASAMAYAAEPSASTPGERLLPDDTLAVATIPDAGEFRRRWNASSLGAMSEDPAFDAFLGDVQLRLGQFTSGLGVNLFDLWKSIDGEITLGLIQNQQQQLSLVAVVDFGANTAAADAFVAEVEERLSSQGGEKTSIQAEALELRSWPMETDTGPDSLAYFVRDGQVVFGDGLETLLSLNLRESDPSATLAGNADYRHVIERASLGGEAPAATWYVNPTKLLDAAVSENLRGNPNLAMLRGLIDAAGLDQFRAVGGAFQIAEGGLDNATTTIGYVEQPVQGILQAFEMPATEQRPPQWVSDDVSLYAQMNWSPARLYEVVGGIVDRIQGPGAFDRLVGSTRIGDSGYTYKDLLEQLTGPLHVTAEIPAGVEDLTQQSAVLAFEVRDAEVMQDIIDELMSTSASRSRQVENNRVYEIEVDSPLPGRAMRLGLSVAEGALMVSPDAAYLEETVRGRETRRPLADSRDYQRVAQRFPRHTSMISYQRQDRRFGGLYEQLRSGSLGASGLMGLPASLLGFDFAKLPPFDAMSRYLQTTGGYIAPAEDGFRIVNFALPPREQ